MNHDEVDANSYKNEKIDWLPYVKHVVLCTIFCYARYSKAMDRNYCIWNEILFVSTWTRMDFNSLRTEEDEPIYTYNGKYMRRFVRQSIKGGRVCAFNQYCKSKLFDDLLKIISEELNVKGNSYDIIEAYLVYKKKRFKFFEKNIKNNLMIIETKMKEKKIYQ